MTAATTKATDEPLTFHGCLRFTFPAKGRPGPHTHGECHEISLITRGVVVTEVHGRSFTGQVGDALLYPQGVFHAPRAGDPLPLEMISLRWTGGEKHAQLSGPTVRRDREGRLFYLLSWMIELFPADPAVLTSLTHAALYEFGRLANPAPSDLATRIIRHIRANLRQPLTVKELAAEAGLSRYHFTRRLKEATGQTPRHLVQMLRVEAARQLLVQTDLKLDAIATEVGLADGTHLSHLFRRLTGSTPGRMRS